jgi:septal ring factor EnvC (AmiA/AmiB activator)
MTGRRDTDSVQDQVSYIRGRLGKMSFGEIAAWGAMVSTVIGMLWGGFQIWLKVEELASLDIGAYQAQMEQTDNKIETQGRLLESIEQNLRDAKQLTYDIEKRVNDKIVRFEDKMDKFEAKVEDTKAELEDKLQKALDNPLSGN